jgi:hypothetical protein
VYTTTTTVVSDIVETKLLLSIGRRDIAIKFC